MRKIPFQGGLLSRDPLTPLSGMSPYTVLAREAAKQEKAGHWPAAATQWEQAAQQALSAENRHWADCRAAFCLRSVSRRSEPHRGELTPTVGGEAEQQQTQK